MLELTSASRIDEKRRRLTRYEFFDTIPVDGHLTRLTLQLQQLGFGCATWEIMWDRINLRMNKHQHIKKIQPQTLKVYQAPSPAKKFATVNS